MIKKRKKKIHPEDLILDEEAVHELEKDLLLDEVEHNEDDDGHHHFHLGHIDDEDDEEDDDDEVEKEIIKTKKPKIDKAKFYIQPKEFDEYIMKYYSDGVISDALAQMIEKIANKLSFSPNFINYSFKDDMIGDAIVKMMKALIGKKYQHNKGSNPFSYFTRIAFNSFICRIKKEKHSQEIHEKYKEELLMFAENYNTIVKNKNIKIVPM